MVERPNGPAKPNITGMIQRAASTDVTYLIDVMLIVFGVNDQVTSRLVAVLKVRCRLIAY